jgi:Tfp pilus assembly major pilin PilA
MKYLLVKLVELMIVVAIIGSISVVGLDMYQDVSGGAKNKAAKANHNSVVQYITLELMRCEVTKTVMEGHLICSEKTVNSVKKATIRSVSSF